MRQFIVTGIILKRKNIGEADRLVTLFTQEFGKILVKAIGVRKIISRRSSHIELLNIVRCGIYKGKGIPVLTEISTEESFSEIKTDLEKVGYAYHICELIDGLCPENQENRQIFYLLKTVLKQIAVEDELSIPIHNFEISLLKHLGYWSDSMLGEKVQTVFMIENILERRLKTRQILPKLFS